MRNTNLFSFVNYKLVGENKKKLLIKVHERWTTIPILKFSSGGGVNQITAGLFDPNVFGRYLELGGQYERLGDTNSGVIWLKKPRLFGKNQGIDIQLWSTNRLRTLYQQKSEQPIISSGFLQTRNKLYLDFFREFRRYVIGNIFYEYNKDSFSRDELSDEVKLKSQDTTLPTDSEYHFLGFGLKFGQVNFDNYKVDGVLLKTSTRYGLSQTKKLENFLSGDIDFLFYKTIKLNSISLAQRLKIGYTTSSSEQYLNYLGGLDRVRGFSDNRFFGKNFWLSNSEIRMPFYQNNWFVAQAVTFVDITAVADSIEKLNEVTGASIGGGLRLFLPKVYRFVVRLDYAQPIIKEDELNFSFGVQQFF